MIVKITRGDTTPPLKGPLKDAKKRPIPLIGAEVTFDMRPKPGCRGLPIVDGVVTVLDRTKAEVQYEWQDGDTDVAGGYSAQFKVTFGDGSVESVPNDEVIDIQIIEGATV